MRSWFVYVVRLADEVDRDAVIDRLRERGIDSKYYLPSIHLFPHIRELGYREGQFPVAEAASAHSMALPFFPGMSEAQIERVCTELAAAVDASRRGRPDNQIIARWHASQATTARTATLRRGSAKSPTRASGG